MGKTFKKFQIVILACTISLISTSQVDAKNLGCLYPDSLRIDDNQRVVQMNLSAETIRKSPHLLLVPITKIRNQNNIQLMIRIKMTWGKKSSSNKKIIGIGNLHLSDPTQIGVYTQQISNVFKHVNVLAEEIEEGEQEVALVFEMTPVSEKKSLEGVEVAIDSVRWETQQRQLFSEN